jgi:lipopolysaccharide biosynthesis glycosyltransferase
MQEEINILFSCDSNYVMPLCVCLTSIFDNNTNNKINIYLLHSGLSEIEEKNINNVATKYNQTINLIHVQKSYFSDAPALRWSKETYYRLLINELIPKNIDRLLYLDVDIIVNKPLNDLYNLDLGEYYISALLENTDYKKTRARLGLNQDGFYYQAGVLVFDLKKTRKILSYDKSMEVIHKLGKNLTTVDQDVMNIIFDGKIKALDKKFNNVSVTIFDGNNIDRLLNKINKKEVLETYILHYASSKPWNNLFSGSCEGIWYKYLKLSPYKNLYDEKFNTLKYKILRTGLVKTFFYAYIDITPFINKISVSMLSPHLYASLKKFYRKYIK